MRISYTITYTHYIPPVTYLLRWGRRVLDGSSCFSLDRRGAGHGAGTRLASSPGYRRGLISGFLYLKRGNYSRLSGGEARA